MRMYLYICVVKAPDNDHFRRTSKSNTAQTVVLSKPPRYVADFDLSGAYILSVHEWFGLRQALLDHGWWLKMYISLCTV